MSEQENEPEGANPRAEVGRLRAENDLLRAALDLRDNTPDGAPPLEGGVGNFTFRSLMDDFNVG